MCLSSKAEAPKDVLYQIRQEDSFMKTAKIFGTAAAALMLSAPAFAHGDHSHNIVANVIHWLSSPAHSLFAVIGGLAFVGLMAAMMRRKKA